MNGRHVSNFSPCRYRSLNSSQENTPGVKCGARIHYMIRRIKIMKVSASSNQSDGLHDANRASSENVTNYWVIYFE